MATFTSSAVQSEREKGGVKDLRVKDRFRRSSKFVLSVPSRIWPLEKVITQFRENKAEQIAA